MISSLPGKSSKTLVELLNCKALPRDSLCALEAEPGRLDIKRCLVFNLSLYNLLHSLN